MAKRHNRSRGGKRVTQVRESEMDDSISEISSND
jgi:hypothetical protein